MSAVTALHRQPDGFDAITFVPIIAVIGFAIAIAKLFARFYGATGDNENTLIVFLRHQFGETQGNDLV